MATGPTAARLANVRYADREYWNSRYQTQPCEFDWFYGYTALRKIVRQFIKRSKLVLHVGCGNSNFQAGMAHDGYSTIVNTDISEVVIDQMKKKHEGVPALRYVVSDCRSMPEFLDCQFGSVIDKGTVDALLCSKEAGEDLTNMFKEISRVLVPGGTFLLITLGGPAHRLALVNRAEFGWTVQVCLVRRVADDQFAPSEPGRAIPLNDTPRPLSFRGPLAVKPDGTLDGLPDDFDPAHYFYAYACRKTPLVLQADNSGGSGDRVRLPDGWRNTVRAVAQVIGGETGLPQGILGRGRRVRTTSRASFERQQREREEAARAKMEAEVLPPSGDVAARGDGADFSHAGGADGQGLQQQQQPQQQQQQRQPQPQPSRREQDAEMLHHLLLDPLGRAAAFSTAARTVAAEATAPWVRGQGGGGAVAESLSEAAARCISSHAADSTCVKEQTQTHKNARFVCNTDEPRNSTCVVAATDDGQPAVGGASGGGGGTEAGEDDVCGRAETLDSDSGPRRVLGMTAWYGDFSDACSSPSAAGSFLLPTESVEVTNGDTAAQLHPQQQQQQQQQEDQKRQQQEQDQSQQQHPQQQQQEEEQEQDQSQQLHPQQQQQQQQQEHPQHRPHQEQHLRQHPHQQQPPQYHHSPQDSQPARLPRTISYGRLSATVSDAFAVLDAVDGDGCASGSNVQLDGLAAGKH